MVTDMVTVHALWYNRHTDMCIVATEEARKRALLARLRPDQVEVVGLPVADRFCQPLGDRKALRQDLGWPEKRPVVLLVGGGEGMGPLEKTAHAIETGCPRAALAVIAGRNQNLKEHLEAHRWKIPTFIYGFVHNMPDLMRAADVLVTKAGPGTISEALIAGLPMILYSRLPGQEDGNVSYIVTKGAGFWAPHPDQIVQKINLLISQPSVRERASAACHRLARPQAARQIAQILAEWVGVKVEQ
jgi:1,2-diacylglycerol 3-beta-galactosyltransferase